MSKPLNERPYAEWLEDFLQNVSKEDPTEICVVTRNPDETILTGYFNCCAEDKAVFAHHIYSDAMMDVVMANADMVVKKGTEMLEEEDNDMEL